MSILYNNTSYLPLALFEILMVGEKKKQVKKKVKDEALWNEIATEVLCIPVGPWTPNFLGVVVSFPMGGQQYFIMCFDQLCGFSLSLGMW